MTTANQYLTCLLNSGACLLSTPRFLISRSAEKVWAYEEDERGKAKNMSEVEEQGIERNQEGDGRTE